MKVLIFLSYLIVYCIPFCLKGDDEVTMDTMKKSVADYLENAFNACQSPDNGKVSCDNGQSSEVIDATCRELKESILRKLGMGRGNQESLDPKEILGNLKVFYKILSSPNGKTSLDRELKLRMDKAKCGQDNENEKIVNENDFVFEHMYELFGDKEFVKCVKTVLSENPLCNDPSSPYYTLSTFVKNVLENIENKNKDSKTALDLKILNDEQLMLDYKKLLNPASICFEQSKYIDHVIGMKMAKLAYGLNNIEKPKGLLPIELDVKTTVFYPNKIAPIPKKEGESESDFKERKRRVEKEREDCSKWAFRAMCASNETSSPKKMFCSFRGTVPASMGTVADLDLGIPHLKCTQEIMTDIVAKQRDGYKIILSGHSLGGGIAESMAAVLANAQDPKYRIGTFDRTNKRTLYPLEVVTFNGFGGTETAKRFLKISSPFKKEIGYQEYSKNRVSNLVHAVNYGNYADLVTEIGTHLGEKKILTVKDSILQNHFSVGRAHSLDSTLLYSYKTNTGMDQNRYNELKTRALFNKILSPQGQRLDNEDPQRAMDENPSYLLGLTSADHPKNIKAELRLSDKIYHNLAKVGGLLAPLSAPVSGLDRVVSAIDNLTVKDLKPEFVEVFKQKYQDAKDNFNSVRSKIGELKKPNNQDEYAKNIVALDESMPKKSGPNQQEVDEQTLSRIKTLFMRIEVPKVLKKHFQKMQDEQ